METENLTKVYEVKSGPFSVAKEIRAVDGVSIRLRAGETLGVVGESGCGKSTLAKLILRLIDPSSGKIYLDRCRFDVLRGRALRQQRKRIQMIFQDPFSSLNPRMTVRSIVGEGLRVHGIAKPHEREERVVDLLESVGMNAECRDRYPKEFSGGQRQRICIARALAVEPELIVADEAVSALDVSIQAQIINLLKQLQHTRGLAFIFISHDLRVVEHLSHRVAIMYQGKIVEEAEVEQLYCNPSHPYSKALLSAIPSAAR